MENGKNIFAKVTDPMGFKFKTCRSATLQHSVMLQFWGWKLL